MFAFLPFICSIFPPQNVMHTMSRVCVISDVSHNQLYPIRELLTPSSLTLTPPAPYSLLSFNVHRCICCLVAAAPYFLGFFPDSQQQATLSRQASRVSPLGTRGIIEALSQIGKQLLRGAHWHAQGLELISCSWRATPEG